MLGGGVLSLVGQLKGTKSDQCLVRSIRVGLITLSQCLAINIASFLSSFCLYLKGQITQHCILYDVSRGD